MNDAGAGAANWDYTEADPDLAVKAHQELSNECGFQYDRSKSQLFSRSLSFYPKGTWLCRLELDPQKVRLRRRLRELKVRTSFYFLLRPSEQSLPIMPLGNDTVWILRANKHYGLNLTGKTSDHDGLTLDLGNDFPDQAMMRRVIEYLHFYYNFTQFDAYAGGPMRLRVPRSLMDLKFSGASSEERCKVAGALWRFMDQTDGNAIRPAIKTITRFINRYQADVPIQVGSALWRLRVSVSLRSGFVRLYGRVPFFHSPLLKPPSPDRVEMLPAPSGLFRWEPWLYLPERFRATLSAMFYFAIAVSWLLAVLVTMAFPLTYLLHPSIVDGATTSLGPYFPIGWPGLWWSALWSVGVFAFIALFVFQFDGVLRRAMRTAPSVLQAAYKALDKLHRAAWDWFRPNLETPWKKASMAALWLCVSTVFLIAEFTTLQIAQQPAKFARSETGLDVMQTFAGHATIAFPGLPYLLGALGFDPLLWLKDPAMTSLIVLGFRVMMLIVVFRAFWKLLGYTSPRILYRESRRLEFEIARKKVS